METKYTRIAFEHATDAELILCAHTCGADETKHAPILDEDHLTKARRVTLTSFIKEQGYNSIQVNPRHRITNPNTLSDFSASEPMQEAPNCAERHAPNRKAAVAFLKQLGLVDAQFERPGTREALPALFGCSRKLAQKFAKRVADAGTLATHGFNFTLIPHGRVVWGGKNLDIEVKSSDGRPLGFMAFIMYNGTDVCHIEFTNYAD